MILWAIKILFARVKAIKEKCLNYAFACRGTRLVEMRRVELLSKNLFISASPSADTCLHSLTHTPNVRLVRLVAPKS